MSVIEYSIKNKSKQLEFYKEVCDKLDKENQQLKEQLQQRKGVIEKVKRMLEINIELMTEQPSENKLEDKFILDRYNDLLDILSKYKKKESNNVRNSK